jgi:hypothetical protein
LKKGKLPAWFFIAYADCPFSAAVVNWFSNILHRVDRTRRVEMKKEKRK